MTVFWAGCCDLSPSCLRSNPLPNSRNYVGKSKNEKALDVFKMKPTLLFFPVPSMHCCCHCLLAQKMNVTHHKNPNNECLQFCLYPGLNQLDSVLSAPLSLYLFVWVFWSQGLHCWLLSCALLLESSKIKLWYERLQDQPVCSSKLVPEAIACKTNPS